MFFFTQPNIYQPQITATYLDQNHHAELTPPSIISQWVRVERIVVYGMLIILPWNIETSKWITKDINTLETIGVSILFSKQKSRTVAFLARTYFFVGLSSKRNHQ